MPKNRRFAGRLPAHSRFADLREHKRRDGNIRIFTNRSPRGSPTSGGDAAVLTWKLPRNRHRPIAVSTSFQVVASRPETASGRALHLEEYYGSASVLQRQLIRTAD